MDFRTADKNFDYSYKVSELRFLKPYQSFDKPKRLHIVGEAAENLKMVANAPLYQIIETLGQPEYSGYHVMLLTENPKYVKDAVEFHSNNTPGFEKINLWIGTHLRNQIDAEEKIYYLCHTNSNVFIMVHDPDIPIDLIKVNSHNMQMDALEGCGTTAISSTQSKAHYFNPISWVVLTGSTCNVKDVAVMKWIEQCDKADVPIHITFNGSHVFNGIEYKQVPGGIHA